MRARAIVAVAFAVALAVALVAAISSTVAAQPDGGPRVVNPPTVDAPVATAFLSARRVTLGKSFYLVVRVVHEPGVTVNLPINLNLGSIDELRRTNAEQRNPDGSFTREFEVEVMAFALGELTIAPLEVTYTARGELGAVRTNPIALEVIGVIGDGQESLRDIAPPVDVHREDYTLVYIAAGVFAGVLLLLIAIALFRRWQRSRRVMARLAATRVLPPADEALARLAELEASGDLDGDDLKRVYLSMSEIVKAYIGRRFGFPANELTTLEIRNELAARPAGERAEAMIRGWLASADLVKFANQAADSSDAREALTSARDFVEKTRRSGEAADDAPAESQEPPATVDAEGEA